MIWTEHMRVNSHDTDYMGILSPTGIMRMMQECANLHVHHCGPSNEQTRKEGKAFLLSRFVLEVNAPLFTYDELDVQTWGSGGQRLLFNRCYRILRDGKEICRAHAVMALIRIADGKLLRQEDYHPNFTYEPDYETPMDDKINLPRNTQDMNLLGTFEANYSVCDRNCHMNNTRYGDALLSFVDTKDKYLKKLAIHYVQEATMGETMTVYGIGGEEGETLIRTIRPDGQVNCEAKIVMAPIPLQ